MKDQVGIRDGIGGPTGVGGGGAAGGGVRGTEGRRVVCCALVVTYRVTVLRVLSRTTAVIQQSEVTKRIRREKKRGIRTGVLLTGFGLKANLGPLRIRVTKLGHFMEQNKKIMGSGLGTGIRPQSPETVPIKKNIVAIRGMMIKKLAKSP